MQGAQQPLILGAATGYSPEQVSLFIDSVKRSGFNGTTALLVDRTNLALQDYLARNGIEVILMDSIPEWMPGWMAQRRFSGGRMRYLKEVVAQFAHLVPASRQPFYGVHVAGPFHHICISRNFHYQRFLLANAHRFSHLLLTDVRDVFFQSDPFAGIPSECLWLFQECSGLIIKNQPLNRSWIEDAFGAKGLERIQQNGVLCAGTTMGSTDLVIEYLRRLAKELIRLTPAAHGLIGFDQAVHNWLFWTGALPRAEVKQNFFGAVATLQLESPDQFEYDGQDRLLNKDGRPTPVLHQYDRHPSVVKRVMAQHARK
jgi:hypothetical protein